MTTIKKYDEIINEEIADSNEITFIINREEKGEVEDENGLIDLNIVNSFEANGKDEFSEIAFDMLVDKIASALKITANRKYKAVPFLEPDEIENVKKMLTNENCDKNKKIILENKLTKFQEDIKINYKQKLKEHTKKRLDYESQIEAFEFIKNQLIMKRLSQMIWPYDAKTKEYDAKITSLKVQLKKCEQKIEEIESMRPAALEKDIILFQVQLKDELNI